jgi:hypothetical protein
MSNKMSNFYNLIQKNTNRHTKHFIMHTDENEPIAFFEENA